MAEHVEMMLSEEEVDKKIQELGNQISKDYAGKSVHLVCVLKGGSFFMCELAKRITVPVSLDFMSVSSYGGDTKSSGVVKIVKTVSYYEFIRYLKSGIINLNIHNSSFGLIKKSTEFKACRLPVI